MRNLVKEFRGIFENQKFVATYIEDYGVYIDLGYVKNININEEKRRITWGGGESHILIEDIEIDEDYVIVNKIYYFCR